MSVVIKTNAMKYKDSNGDYQGFNAIAQESTAQQLADIASAGQDQVTAIQQKGAETYASIPNDYTELSDDVTDLKSQINDVPPVKESTEEDVDIDISDLSGNVIARFANGGIQVKNFDSSDVGNLEDLTTTEKGSLVGAINEAATTGGSNVSKVEVKTQDSDSSADLYLTDQSGNGLVRFANGHIRTKSFCSDNGIYESQFAYANTAGTETMNHFFPSGTRLAFHLTNCNERERDGIKSIKVTYKYTDTGGTTRTLGMDYGYNFPEYVLAHDAVSVSVQYGSALADSETTLSFKVYAVASFRREPHIITVSESGEKDFTSIRAAVEYARQAADELNRYEIWIYPGTYDILSYYTAEEIAVEGFIGLLLSNGISLIGIGQRAEVILTATMDTDQYSSSKRNYVSTINIRGNVSIKNMTIKGENIRYAVHDDLGLYGHQNNTHVFENVTFYGKNMTSSNDGNISYGAGGADLKKLFFHNCDFSDTLTLHTATGMNHEYTAYFENCRARRMQFGDYNSGMPTHVYLKNCAVSLIYILNQGNHQQYMLIEGEGVYGALVESPAGYVYTMDGVHKFDGSNVSSGVAVKLDSDMDSVITATALNEIYGISIGVLNGITYVQTEGWMNSNTLGLSGLSVGDYLTIDSNGSVVSGGTSSNAIAQVKFINSTGVAFAKLTI